MVRKIIVKRKAFVGHVVIRNKGKIFGGTTRQVNAKDKIEVRKILKKKFGGFGNKVTVTKIIRLKRRAKK